MKRNLFGWLADRTAAQRHISGLDLCRRSFWLVCYGPSDWIKLTSQTANLSDEKHKQTRETKAD